MKKIYLYFEILNQQSSATFDSFFISFRPAFQYSCRRLIHHPDLLSLSMTRFDRWSGGHISWFCVCVDCVSLIPGTCEQFCACETTVCLSDESKGTSCARVVSLLELTFVRRERTGSQRTASLSHSLLLFILYSTLLPILSLPSQTSRLSSTRTLNHSVPLTLIIPACVTTQDT